MPTTPLLPNSAPHILKPMQHPQGVLQVRWVPDIDKHVLDFTRNDATDPVQLAAHHNGYSCHALAERIIKGDPKRALEQLDYLQDCGGLACDLEAIVTIMAPDSAPAGGIRRFTVRAFHRNLSNAVELLQQAGNAAPIEAAILEIKRAMGDAAP